MVKSKFIVIVESVEDAVKFYTEKLAFDLVDVATCEQDPTLLASASLRKSKLCISFRRPYIEEFAAFSFIKRCACRCISISVDLKRDIERFFNRCIKKNVKIIRPLSPYELGGHVFVVRDPFGIELTFIQRKELRLIPAQATTLCGINIDQHNIINDDTYSNQISDEIIEHLRGFGIVRRAAKKLVKTKMKELS